MESLVGAGRRAAPFVVLAAAAYGVAWAWLPAHLPLAVALYGVVVGSLNALVALGLVLVYRSARIINFAQVTVGGLAASVAIVAMVGWHWPWAPSAALGLVVALASGWLVDAVVVRRLRDAPRLVLTVATVGVLLVFAAAEIVVPNLTTHLGFSSGFVSPVSTAFTFSLNPEIFSGDAVLAMLVVPLVLAGLWWFLERTELGTAVRASADAPERALLLGVPVRRLSSVVWVVAAGLSGIGAILSAPVTHAQFVGIASGPVDLLPALAGAVLARFESLPRAFFWSLGIGVLDQGVLWSYSESSKTDVALFVLVLVGLLVQHGSLDRVRSWLHLGRSDTGDAPASEEWGGFDAVRPVHPVPRVLAVLPEVRAGKAALLAVCVIAAALVPMAVSPANLVLLTSIAIYVMVGVSLVVLTGWAGQISLGQFAFVGVGSVMTAVLVVHAGADLFVALLASAAVGGLVACVVGIPAFRLPGLSLAAATLAFAVPVSTFLLSSAHFPFLNPTNVNRPVLFGRFPLGLPATGRAFYLLCLAMLGVALLLARNFRRTRAGRAVVAVRDNTRAAAAYGISPLRAKLAAFALSGAIAGMAGGLFVLSVNGTGAIGIDPNESIWILAGVVVGGLGSLGGAVLGAAFVESVRFYLPGASSDIVLGVAVLVVLMVLPEGLAGVLYALRDRVLAAVAVRRGIDIDPAASTAGLVGGDTADPVDGGPPAGVPVLAGLETVDVHIGRAHILAGVRFGVAEGEVVALLGTNGAGKSTILRTMAGVLHPTSGLDHRPVARIALGTLAGERALRKSWRGVVLDGEEAAFTTPEQRVRMGMATVPGGRGVFRSLTVAENLRVAGWTGRRSGERSKLDDARGLVDELFPRLAERTNVKAGSLSGGEQQMLAIAMALLCSPRVLLIDELSLGLAPTVVGQLLETLQRLVDEGVTVVLVEQSVNVASVIAKRAVVLERGRVRFCGATAELLGRPQLLRSVFLGGAVVSSIAGKSRRSEAAPVTVPTALRAIEVSKWFGGVAALSEVSVQVASGEILGLIGANGAGKTTLLDVCSGFLAADGGRVELDGSDVSVLGAPARARLGLGRVFQDAALFRTMTVAETLATALEGQVEVRDPFLSLWWTRAVKESEAAVMARVDEVLATMGLERFRDRLVSELSTGTRRVLELACVAVHDPSVLLLDEPSAGVAQREAEALVPLLRDLRDRTGAAFVVVEHDVAFVSSLCDRVVCLHLGEVIAVGTPAEVLADPAVVDAYLGADQVARRRSGALPAASPA